MEEDAVDPGVRWGDLVAERERLTAVARDRLAGFPDAVKKRFEESLIAGQEGQRLQEDHNWWIDQRGTHTMRMVLLEIGRRFAEAGVIDDSGGIFYLDGDEIRDVFRAGIFGDYNNIVVDRRNEMVRWARVKPPESIGTKANRPALPSAMTRAMGRFFGSSRPAPDPERPDVLYGIAGSSGKSTGVARVIIHLGDAGRLQRGDILVTQTTNPPWTPLFATAGGIVTDTGGPLSHCAIVAREYGLPAVVGTGTGTDFIKDGQMVEVDGDTGEVRVLQP